MLCKHPSSTVLAILQAAMQMLHNVRKEAERQPDLARIRLQIGINAGPAVEAILGRQLLPRWKLFGDTVNTASRMKSNGMPNRIHLSEMARDAVAEAMLQVLQANGVNTGTSAEAGR